MAALLSACVPAQGSALVECPSVSPDSVVITATATSAEPAPGIPAQVRELLVAQGKQADGCVVLVDPQGHRLALSLTPRRSPTHIEKGSHREELRIEILNEVETYLATMAATSDELDLLAKLRTVTAARDGTWHVVVISSGLQSVPRLALQNPWPADPVAYGRFLFQNRYLDLTGYVVDFVGLGETGGTQPPLDPAVRGRLVDLWLGICRSAGATDCRDLGPLPGRGPSASNNHVQVIDPPVALPQPIDIPDSQFGRDLATLGRSAATVLRDIADMLRSSESQVDICGYADASTGSAAHNQHLSQRRASAVANALFALGVSKDGIRSISGRGSTPFDAATERADPQLVATHRVVRIQFVYEGDPVCANTP